MNSIFLVGPTLKRLRVEKRISVKRISLTLNLSRNIYERLENDHSYPKYLDMLKVAKYHDITIQELTDLILKDNERRN